MPESVAMLAPSRAAFVLLSAVMAQLPYHRRLLRGCASALWTKAF